MEFFNSGNNIIYVGRNKYASLLCPQPIYRWFKGIVLPSVDHLYALSRLLQVHMEELLVPESQIDIVIDMWQSTPCMKWLDFLSNDKFYIIFYPLIRTEILVKIGGFFMRKANEEQVLLNKRVIIRL